MGCGNSKQQQLTIEDCLNEQRQAYLAAQTSKTALPKQEHLEPHAQHPRRNTLHTEVTQLLKVWSIQDIYPDVTVAEARGLLDDHGKCHAA